MNTPKMPDQPFLNIHDPFTSERISVSITYSDKQCYMLHVPGHKGIAYKTN